MNPCGTCFLMAIVLVPREANSCAFGPGDLRVLILATFEEEV